MRDPVFEAQFRNMKDSFARQGVQIDVAYQPNGEVDFMYEVDRLLAPNDDDLIDRMARALPGLRRAHIPGQDGPPGDDVVLLAIDDLEGGRMSVPEAVRHLSANIGAADGRPPFSPNHVFHISRTCPAVEPERPCNDEFTPCPPVCTQEPADDEQPEVRIGVSDTGLLQDIAAFPWLAGVEGDLDPLAPGRPGGPPRIPEFTGHGTFIAGVARSMAPRADVFVNNHFSKSGGELENVMIRRLFDLAAAFQPHIINLSAGTYMYGNWAPLALGAFHQKYPDMTLVAAAGNDSTDRPFYPAALDWVVGVGSLASDQVNRAWFSNFGEWVDVYALGEGMVNAYAVGEYIYQEPPRRPARQNFTGMARWSGTSFSAPLVAGLIAARMARTGESSTVAADVLKASAKANPLPEVGPALYPCQHE